MKALRRSIKGEKDKPQVSIAPKSAVAIVPPKKVIRALYDYEAQSEQELSFSRGDFFHVIGRETDPDWYEACNPALPDARGLVPVAFFQALGRTERDSAQSDGGHVPVAAAAAAASKNPDHDSGYAEGPVPQRPGSGAIHRMSRSGKSGAMVYGIVMYDFQAERGDELEAKAGEAIIVIAQSNPEWFVAKPIGRLGGPGLIPVSFVEIRDMATDKAVPNPADAVKKAGVPKVEEWKKMAAEYKNSSITLGKFEGGSSTGQNVEQGMERLSLQQQARRSSQNGVNQATQQQIRSSQQGVVAQNPHPPKSVSQMYAPVSARIPRYCFAEDKYWFVIEATLEDGRHWELSRYYEDFYDFQIALLTEFPAEAGNTGTQKRTLPYMPGPVNYVTDAITEGRLHNLDAYVKNLLAQPPYISRCMLVKQFFAPREGDYEIDPNSMGDDYRLSVASQPSSTDSPADGASRQSSRNNLNGAGYSGLSAAPQRPGLSQATSAMSAMSRQASSLSQPSQTSISPGVNQAVSAMKVKLCFNGDLIAIRVPTDIQFQQLYDKVRERLKIPADETIELFYKDERTGDKPNLLSNNDLDIALQRNEKLMLYVEQV
ncbi:SH3 domain-containing protein [Sodiomyces alkalinus F11]|uniref:SH3 domain-containing protein n=1 Tax=Sodiomyces alkalinus (strain CBS 110278 / VKM F-3762 / F11) TaxID=1314773 RepID=A0A3N2Q7Z3_SODAK|nr:SH3 domain-containing protein [Sodiomyces alkalinus F11]ROT42894.1 SH3 domain-containing protein [Sodiomyces alkalinus F11]